jgi:hypothetical protein
MNGFLGYLLFVAFCGAFLVGSSRIGLASALQREFGEGGVAFWFIGSIALA